MTLSPAALLSTADRVALAATRGVVFDVQRFSVHDGPGLRTNVFLKGCPLRCPWCANPESQRAAPQPAVFAGQCIRCGQHAVECPLRWEESGGRLPAAEMEARMAACPVEAVRMVGAWRTAGDVLDEVRRDAPFYAASGAAGGMTLTGGEPTAQPAFAGALLRLARAEGIATALETCGQTAWPALASLLPHVDTLLFDIKHPDSAAHAAATGAGNERILDNLARARVGRNTARGAAAPSLVVRVPLIPDFNADAAAMERLAALLVELLGPGAAVDLLPYHTLMRVKYRALARPYTWSAARLDGALVTQLVQAFAAHGLDVVVGG